MSYSNFYLQNRNRPPLLLYVLAFLAIGGLVATFFRPGVPTTRASKETLISHSIVNVSSHQAGVYYQTTNPTTSWVLFGNEGSSLSRAAFDERDTEENKSTYNLHLVQLKDLEENTSYSYQIIADGEVVSVNNQTTFSFKTPATFTTNTGSVPPAYGKVIEPNNEPVSNGFVVYYYPRAFPIVSFIKGGDWLIALNSLVERSSGKPITPKTSETVKIEIMNEELKNTTFETLLGNTTPLPKTVIIGTPYANDSEENVLSEHDELSAASTPTSAPVTTPSSELVEITFPKNEAIIPGNNPLIKGYALPNTQVSLALKNSKSALYSTKLTADAKGEWKLSLPMVLQPMSHTLTMSAKDSSGKTVTQTRVFTTTKSGEEVVLGTATDEATLTPSPQVLTPTQVIAQVSPTSAIYATPTPIPTQVVYTTPPVAGDNNTLIMVGSLALVVVAAGVLLIL